MLNLSSVFERRNYERPLLKGLCTRLFLEPGHPLKVGHSGSEDGLVVMKVFELVYLAFLLAFFSFFFLLVFDKKIFFALLLFVSNFYFRILESFKVIQIVLMCIVGYMLYPWGLNSFAFFFCCCIRHNSRRINASALLLAKAP